MVHYIALQCEISTDILESVHNRKWKGETPSNQQHFRIILSNIKLMMIYI